MKIKLKIFIVLLIFTTIVKSQTAICISNGLPISLDGIVNESEWQDAESIFLGTGNQTKVYYKHDETNLLIAFEGNLESAFRFPEILIDVNNDKGPSWEANDWWFHVSAQDCEYQGQYGNFVNCAEVRPNWLAVENFSQPSPPFVNTIEVEIPFSTLNIDLNSVDTIGLSFIVTNAVNSWIHWPGSANRNIPSSWGSATFCTLSLHEHQKSKSEIKISPNPTGDILKLTFIDRIPTDRVTIYIYDETGKEVIKKTFSELTVPDIEIDLTGVSEGIYLINIIEKNNVIGTNKFILN